MQVREAIRMIMMTAGFWSRRGAVTGNTVIHISKAASQLRANHRMTLRPARFEVS
jgi:hypothetical protein